MQMRYRPLGRTGFMASQIAAGDLADRSLPIETCVATLTRALDAGVNVVDTAPGYEDGFSEQIVGAAVRPRRDDVYVIDKIDDFTRPLTDQLAESLQRLGFARIDAYLFHGLSSLDEYRRLTAPNGLFEEAKHLKAVGKIRHMGISSHHPDVLRHAILDGWCDVAMFAIGAFVDSRYMTDTLPLCRAQGVGSVCFKTCGAGKLVADTTGYGAPLTQRPRGKRSSGGVDGNTSSDVLTPAECLHFTLTVDPDVALLGMSFPNEQDHVFAAYAQFQPLTTAQLDDIAQRAVQARAGKGPCWWNPNPDA
jgi:aryl-alcohol dehydrogenase-like predicted oxidoreductase